MASSFEPPWKQVRLDEVAIRGSGHTPNKKHPEYWDGDIPWVSLKDTFRLDQGSVMVTSEKITAEGLAHSSAVLHPKGTVILLRDAGIGKSGIMGADMAVSQHFMAWRCGSRLDNWFLYYYLQHMKPEFERISNGSTIKTIGLDYFKQFTVPLPPIEEQRPISLMLREADDLISKLERLIAKKQAIKQGMMQQLLTGRTRLPGFMDPWVPIRLRDVGSTYGGLVGKSKADFGTGSATFITFVEVMSGARLRGNSLGQVNVRPTERQNRVQRGDVLFNGSSETPDEVALSAVIDYDPSPTTYLNSFCFGYRLRERDSIDPTYLAHFFRSGEGRLLVSALAQGATRYNIAKTKLLDTSPVLPSIVEQRAIAEVLMDSESEVEVLQMRLTKARAVKTGMMQQLLTGGARLPVEAAS
jgi:type I restriction enzyme S subunit